MNSNDAENAIGEGDPPAKFNPPAKPNPDQVMEWVVLLMLFIKIFCALLAVLYLVTAAATGIQIFLMLLWAAWGRPYGLTDLFAICGVGFLGAGAATMVASFFVPKTINTSLIASCIGGIGCLLLWTLYAPDVHFVTVNRREISAIRLVPPVLLTGSSILSLLGAMASLVFGRIQMRNP